MSISVLHILPSLALGGAERVTIELAHIQRREGLDAQILSLGSDLDFLVAEVRHRDIPLHICSSGPSKLQRFRAIGKCFEHFDVLHVHSPRGLSYISPIIPFYFRKKIIYTRHGLDPLNTTYWRLVHRVMRPFIDCVTFVTQSGYEVFAENQRWSEAKMRVVTNGVNVPDITVEEPSKPIRFGSVGRMVELKGQPILLDAILKLEEQFGQKSAEIFKLKFFGTGPMEDHLRKLAERIGNDIVEFCGEVQDLESIYSEIDVVVVASESEGLSMVIIEAMARGIPAIGTNVGGNPTLIHNEVTGHLVPYGDSSALFTAMMKILENCAAIQKYGTAARELIQDNFSLENMHKSYLDCYIESSNES